MMGEKVKKPLTVEDELYRWGWGLLPFGLLGAYFVTVWIAPRLSSGADCLFWKFFGIYCPGCGGTRALVAFCKGRFLLSAWYHPVIMYVALMYGWFMLSHTLEKLHFPLIKGMKFRVWEMYGALVVLGINFVIKNILNLGFHIVM